MIKDLSLDSRDLHTPICSLIQCTVEPHNENLINLVISDNEVMDSYQLFTSSLCLILKHFFDEPFIFVQTFQKNGIFLIGLIFYSVKFCHFAKSVKRMIYSWRIIPQNKVVPD